MMRRRAVLAGAAVMPWLSACTEPSPNIVASNGPEVLSAEADRHPGPVRNFALQPVASEVDIGGPVVKTWSYGGRIPGAPIRVRAGEQINATLTNGLPEPTSVHWHGIALRNDTDGVPGVTQPAIENGATYSYLFTAPDPGTYWLHPHSGLQADRGLYAPLIVEDPAEPLSYDDEWIVVLDDWLDGIAGATPEQTLAALKRRGGHMMRATTGGDVDYPYYLLNGHGSADPQVWQGKPGERVRIRLINAGGDTAFRFAIGGHRLTVTHADGFPVLPVTVDALVLGMGERYDVLVTLADGVFAVVAVPEGKQGKAFGLVRTAPGRAPDLATIPRELGGRVLGYADLKPDPLVALADRAVSEAIRLELTGGMMSYDWGINGRAYDASRIIPVAAKQRIRLDFVNRTMMWHPVHLHGHTFAVGSAQGPRKDTVLVLPGESVPVFFDTSNPGRWMVHCHNVYHAEAGMMALIGYRR